MDARMIQIIDIVLSLLLQIHLRLIRNVALIWIHGRYNGLLRYLCVQTVPLSFY